MTEKNCRDDPDPVTRAMIELDDHRATASPAGYAVVGYAVEPDIVRGLQEIEREHPREWSLIAEHLRTEARDITAPRSKRQRGSRTQKPTTAAMNDGRTYVQIADVLRARIDSREYPINTAMPGERSMKDEFNCSIETAGNAQKVLRDEGLIKRWPGKGYYVIAMPGIRAARSSDARDAASSLLKPPARVIRRWARKHGYPVSSNGVLPQYIEDAYNAATKDSASG